MMYKVCMCVYICSMQSGDLQDLQIMLCNLRIVRLEDNLQIVM